MEVFVGIDVGSASVRAVTTDNLGVILSTAESPIERKEYANGYVTQNGDQIWAAVKDCVKSSLRQLLCDYKVGGVACAATCSLVVMQQTDTGLMPYAVDPEKKDSSANVIMWMDTRADMSLFENLPCDILGGNLSPEMAIPKVCSVMAAADYDESLRLFDLHDFLSYKLGNGQGFECHHKNNDIGIDGSLKGYSKVNLATYGLSKLAENNFRMVGRLEKTKEHNGELVIPFAGCRIGTVDREIALELGMLGMNDTNVVYIGHGIIDSYGGWISTHSASEFPQASLIAGTSTCIVMTLPWTAEHPVDGLWGPFHEIARGICIYEGGQSASGLLIEHVIKSHPAYPDLIARVESTGRDVFSVLEDVIGEYSSQHEGRNPHYLTRTMLMYGDIAGNRTPLNDSTMTGAFIGETTDLSLHNLAAKYIVALEFLVMQVFQIVEHFNHKSGRGKLEKVVVTGSFAKNKRYLSLLSMLASGHFDVLRSLHAKHDAARGAALLGISAYRGHSSVVNILEQLPSVNTEKCHQEALPYYKETGEILRRKYSHMLRLMGFIRIFNNEML